MMEEALRCTWVGLLGRRFDEAELASIELRAQETAVRDDVAALLDEIRALYKRHDLPLGRCDRPAIARYVCKGTGGEVLVLRCDLHDPETHGRFHRGVGGLTSREELPDRAEEDGGG